MTPILNLTRFSSAVLKGGHAKAARAGLKSDPTRSGARANLSGAKKTAAALICLALLLSAGCGQKHEPAAPPPPKVTVSRPVLRDIVNYLEASGNTQAVNTVQLRARVEGYLEGAYFRDGDVVKKGRLLFVIQQNTYQAQLKQAEGNVQNEKALLEHAKIEFARYSKLYAQKAAADTDVENWRFQRDTARAGLLSAMAQLQLARLNLGYTRVVAPFTGRMDRRLVDPGNLVGSSGSNTVLAQMTQIDPLYVYFNIAETLIPPYIQYARLLSPKPSGSKGSAGGLPVYMGLATEKGYPHEGRLDFASNTVSASTGTLLLRGVFPNPDGKIFPGEFVRVRLPLGPRRPAVLIPQAAVQYDQLGAYALIVNSSGTVERRNVETGAARGFFLVIKKGLTGDEWVVVRGALKAIPGKKVTPVRVRTQEEAKNPAKG